MTAGVGVRVSIGGARSSRAQRAVGDRARAAADRDHAGLDELLDAERLEHAQQRLELVRVAGRLDGDRVRGDVDDLGAEQLRRSRATCERVSWSARTLTSSSSRCTDAAGLELDDLDDVDQLVELLGDLLERQRPRR